MPHGIKAAACLDMSVITLIVGYRAFKARSKRRQAVNNERTFDEALSPGPDPDLLPDFGPVSLWFVVTAHRINYVSTHLAMAPRKVIENA
jgi:hypothetical protein